MSVRAIEAEVSIKSGVSAECTIGREVPHYIDRPIYGGQTEVYPSDADIVLFTAGLAVESDILIHAIPKPENVYEGEFIGTEEGVLTIDTGYEGDGFPKAILIHPVSGIMQLDDDFYRNASIYSLNTVLYIKTNKNPPTYPDTDSGSSNQVSLVSLYKTDSVTQFQAWAAINNYLFTKTSNEGKYGSGNALRVPNNHTLKVFATDTPSGNSSHIPTGIRYKYQVFY